MKVIFHIGMVKTGTTSLQYFLYKNKTKLQQQGIIYDPDSFWGHQKGVLGESYYSHSIFFSKLLHRFKDYQTDCEFLKKKIDTSNAKYYIISSEHLSAYSLDDILSLKKYLHDYDIEIVLYIRRQDDIYDSLYRHFSKMNTDFTKATMYFSNFIKDYKEIVDNWSNIGNIKIFKYNSKDTIQQFIDYYKFDIYPDDAERFNPSLSRDATEVSRHILASTDNRLKISPAENMALMSELIEDEENSKKYVYSLNERKQILAFYEKGNQFISNNFFDGQPLFAPLPEQENDSQPYPSMSIGKIIHMLSKIIFYNAKQTSYIKKLTQYILDSDDFDHQFYSKTYCHGRTDLPYSPIEHFVRYGMYNNLKPNNNFDANQIYEQIPSLKKSGIPPYIVHLVLNALKKDSGLK